ncbi:MAG: hypothetical protein E6J71_08585, partial [Deltaproteobacteria bacterium]
MTVRCPRCATLYRRPGRIATGAAATFRCARCRHVFGVGVEEPDVGSDPDLSLDDDEGFVFDAGEPEVEPESTDEVVAERPPRANRPGRRP